MKNNILKNIFFVFLALTTVSNFGMQKAEAQKESDLLWATRVNNTDGVRRILSEGINNLNIYETKFGVTIKGRTFKNITPLMWAASHGNREMIELLLKAGAQANLENKQGISAAEIAIAFNHPEIAKSLRGGQTELCPICNENPADVLTSCSHGFCNPCLLRWLGTGKNTCPICRKALVKP